MFRRGRQDTSLDYIKTCLKGERAFHGKAFVQDYRIDLQQILQGGRHGKEGMKELNDLSFGLLPQLTAHFDSQEFLFVFIF